jgi:hypothetical protein
MDATPTEGRSPASNAWSAIWVVRQVATKRAADTITFTTVTHAMTSFGWRMKARQNGALFWLVSVMAGRSASVMRGGDGANGACGRALFAALFSAFLAAFSAAFLPLSSPSFCLSRFPISPIRLDAAEKVLPLVRLR